MIRKYNIDGSSDVGITENEKTLIGIPLGNIENFDNLPSNANLGDIYYVLSPKTVLGITTKRKGRYKWNGTEWKHMAGDNSVVVNEESTDIDFNLTGNNLDLNN